MCLSSLLGNKLLSNNVHLYISSLSLVLHVQRVIRAWGRCFPWISLTFQIKAAALPHTRTRFIGVTGLHCCTFLSSHYSHKLAGSPDGKKKKHMWESRSPSSVLASTYSEVQNNDLWHKDFNFSSHCPGSLLEETPRALKYSKSRTDHLPPANCATADHLSPSKQTDTKAGLRFFLMNVQERSCTVAAPKTGVTSECIQHFLSASSYKHERGN